MPQPAALDIEIINKTFDDKVLWKWSSKGHLSTALRVSTDASMHAPYESRTRRVFGWLRNCYTSIIRRALKFGVPRWRLLPGGATIFDLEENDYVHVNSIQRLEPAGDILVSARHLDTIFIMTGGGPGNATETIALATYRYSFRNYDMGLGSAVSYIIFAVVFVLSIFFVRQMQRARIT